MPGSGLAWRSRGGPTGTFLNRTHPVREENGSPGARGRGPWSPPCCVSSGRGTVSGAFSGQPGKPGAAGRSPLRLKRRRRAGGQAQGELRVREARPRSSTRATHRSSGSTVRRGHVGGHRPPTCPSPVSSRVWLRLWDFLARFRGPAPLGGRVSARPSSALSVSSLLPTQGPAWLLLELGWNLEGESSEVVPAWTLAADRAGPLVLQMSFP